MSTRKIYLQIEILIEEAKEKIKEAQRLADENDLKFSYDFGFGINGTYYGSKEDDWNSSNSQEWTSSSAHC